MESANEEVIINNDDVIDINENTQKGKDSETRNYNRIEKKNPRISTQNVANENSKFDNELNYEKTIFSKITEDIYVYNLNVNKKMKTKFLNDNKKDDDYNKLTVENYLYNLADKENFKNSKLISSFLERKGKERIIKIISFNKPKEEMLKNSSELNVKRVKLEKSSSSSRTNSKFIDDQKIYEERRLKKLNHLIKVQNNKINLSLKEKPNISENSRLLANIIKKKSKNKNVFIKLYSKKNECEISKDNIFSESPKSTNRHLTSNKIQSNSQRLFLEYKKKEEFINRNRFKRFNELQNLSSISLINKNSTKIISQKLIGAYIKIFKELFHKDISDNYIMSFKDYLLFIYALGLVDNNYNNKSELQNNKLTRKKLNRIYIKKKEKIPKSKGKINLLFKTNHNENETEFEYIKDSWKIITKTENFDDKLTCSSYRVLILYLTLCGIYKGNLEDEMIKKRFPFLAEEIKDVNNTLAEHIFKHFRKFRYLLILKIENHKNKNENSMNRKALSLNNKEIKHEKKISKSENKKVKVKKKIYICRKNGNTIINSVLNPSMEGNKTEEKVESIKSKREHKNEKNSSISQYILNEDYRIKDDIETNSNINDNGNLKHEGIKSPKTCENKEKNTPILENKNEKGKKYIFKIKMKDNFHLLEIRKGEQYLPKVIDFCKEYKLNEEDKTKILKIIKLKLDEK